MSSVFGTSQDDDLDLVADRLEAAACAARAD
jgi:hypothetical protein